MSWLRSTPEGKALCVPHELDDMLSSLPWVKPQDYGPQPSSRIDEYRLAALALTSPREAFRWLGVVSHLDFVATLPRAIWAALGTLSGRGEPPDDLREWPSLVQEVIADDANYSTPTIEELVNVTNVIGADLSDAMQPPVSRAVSLAERAEHSAYLLWDLANQRLIVQAIEAARWKAGPKTNARELYQTVIREMEAIHGMRRASHPVPVPPTTSQAQRRPAAGRARGGAARSSKDPIERY